MADDPAEERDIGPRRSAPVLAYQLAGLTGERGAEWATVRNVVDVYFWYRCPAVVAERAAPSSLRVVMPSLGKTRYRCVLIVRWER
jgi:hypothetical protein